MSINVCSRLICMEKGCLSCHVATLHVNYPSQYVGKSWEPALAQLHTCTCAWTNTRKTGLRISHGDGLPEVRSGSHLCFANVTGDPKSLLLYLKHRMRSTK